MSDYTKPIPIPSIESKPYWDGLKQHKLLMQRCDGCGKFWFPPSLLCPHCNDGRFTWSETKGTGRVFSFVVYHRVYHPGFADEVPYTVAVIELDEGPRLISNVIGIPPDQVVCDMRVKIAYDDITDAMTIPKFAPV
jgi:uncharacterized protein